ncbi:hypothetical protein SAMD00019534_067150 [Acytostelium subglobosum LB1]|uniref:hypothetical protein n=1 Tax=Acytostelium subglobosum LB1 TaxID=1410327 RepID=UPI0006451783|nr:hypothetical protein SAMD00019534_067150 [Acytostelium subglobosum LB1]GAM23540.1 hypothetical protein SAMD00019534_067150 [Acytostelium subglobosum LB1]|eukprot:XP_012753281.1 hypothetical protein SAMD00019534_067150 [Acytostelium subglobosum LB1]
MRRRGTDKGIKKTVEHEQKNITEELESESSDDSDVEDQSKNDASKMIVSLNKSHRAIKALAASSSSNSTTSISDQQQIHTHLQQQQHLPENQSLIEQHKKKILYTLRDVDPKWIDEQLTDDQQDEEAAAAKEMTSNQASLAISMSKRKRYLKHIQMMINYIMGLPMQSVRLFSRTAARQFKLSPLHIHNMQQAGARILLSNDGRLLANTQNSSIVIRSIDDDFNSIRSQWDNPKRDRESQWQRMCFSPDNSLLAFSTSECTIYIISVANECLLHILPPSVLGLDAKVGIVDLAMRHSSCSLLKETSSSGPECNELLIMGYDMKLRSFHVPTDSSTPHAVRTSDHSGCIPGSPTIDVNGAHHEVGCMDYCAETDILAIGGNRRSKKSRNSSIKPFVSFWKLTDQAPYFKLLNAPNKESLEQSIDGLNSSGGSIATSPSLESLNQQQSANKGFTSKLTSRLTKAVFGHYFPGIILHKITFSKDGQYLLGLDLNGAITMWSTPRPATKGKTPIVVKPSKTWNTVDLLNIWDKAQPSSSSSYIQAKSAIDISWWSNDQIIMANRVGEFVIFSITTNDNCLVHNHEQVYCSQPPRLTRASGGHFFILETSGSLPKKTTLVSVTQDYYNLYIKRVTIAAYKYIYRYFYGDHPDDYHPFVYQINRGNQPHDDMAIASPDDNELEQNIVRHIIRFQSTTPEELFLDKVALKEYKNAIIIAELYGLDKDLVHQKRWSKAVVSNESIRSYLSKVHDINWIMWECHTRIPSTYESTKLLLEYALEKSGEFINENSSPDTLKEHATLIVHRNIVVNYLNRLVAYKEIYGTSFNALDFLRFRGCNLVLAAMEYANSEHFKAIEVLFTYYSRQVLSARLAILSMIPETTDPNQYAKLLPDVNYIWQERKQFKADWSQSKEIFDKALPGFEYDRRTDSNYLCEMLALTYSHAQYEDIRGKDKAEDKADIYALDYVQVPFDDSGLKAIDFPSPQDISKWYIGRAEEIDRKCGQIDNSLNLIQIGISLDVPDLLTFQAILEQVALVVYETNQDMSLQRYLAMSPFERLSSLLNDSTTASIYKDIAVRTTSFRSQHSDTFDSLLEQFFIEKAKCGKIALVRSYLESVKSNDSTRSKSAPILALGLNCIRECTSDGIDRESIAQMELIIAALPERSSSSSSTTQRLYDMRSDYSRYIQANKILQVYDQARPIQYFVDAQAHPDDPAAAMLQDLFRHAKKAAFKNIAYRAMFEDFLKVRQLVFFNAVQANLYSQFVRHLLSEGKYSLSKDYFEECGPGRVEALILAAAKELYNSAPSFHSENITEAVICLELLKPPTQRIVRELNLIKASELMSKYQYPKIPLQARLILDKGVAKTTQSPKQQQQNKKGSTPSPSSYDISPYENQGRFELIKALLDNNTGSYKDIRDIRAIAALLSHWVDDEQVDDSLPYVDDEIIVLVILARKALECSDYQAAFDVCKELMKKNIPASYKEVNRIFARLTTDDRFTNLDDRMELLSHCLVTCEQGDLTMLLEQYQELELRRTLITSAIMSPILRSSNSGDMSQKTVLQKFEQDRLALTSRVHELPDNDEANLQPPYIEAHYSLSSLLDEHDGNGDEDDENDDDHDGHEARLARQRERILHVDQLIDFITNGTTEQPTEEEIQSLLRQLSKYSLHSGQMQNALAYLFMLKDQSIVDATFDHLVNSSKSDTNFQTSLERVTRLACYYYSARLLTIVGANNNSSPLVDTAAIFTKPIDGVLYSALSIATDTTDSDTNLHALAQSVLKYSRLLTDSVQAKEFSEIDSSVDFSRFKEDPEYKRDTILQFAATNDAKSFLTALTLAARYNIPREDILIRYIQWKIMEDGSGFSQQCLLSSEDLALLAQDHHASLDDIYRRIDGHDYEQLKFYYELLERMGSASSDASEKSLIKHKKNLLSLLLKSTKYMSGDNKSFEPLDFKAMVDDSTYDLYRDTLQACLREDNITFCCKLISQLQSIRHGDDETIQNYTVSTMYRQLIANILSDKSRDVISVVSKHRNNLDEHDLLDVFEMIALGEYSNRMTAQERIDVLNVIAGSIARHSDTGVRMKEIVAHLNTMKALGQLTDKWSPPGKQLLCVDYHNAFVKYIAEHSTLEGLNEWKKEQLDTLIPELIQNHRADVSPNTCLKIYKVISGSGDSDQKSKIMDYYLKEIDGTLAEMDSTPKDNPASLSQLAHSLQNLVKAFTIAATPDSNKWEADKHRLLSPLRDYAYSPSHSNESRILIFELLKTTPSLYNADQKQLAEQDHTQLKQNKTKEIILETWKDLSISFEEMDITTPESSRPLFNRLLESSTTLQHVSYLSELLTMWSTVGKHGDDENIEYGANSTAHVLHDCWCKLLLAFIPYFSAGNTKAINQFLRLRIDQLKQFPMEQNEESTIMDALKPADQITFFKFGLLSNYSNIQDIAIDSFKEYLASTYPSGAPPAGQSVTNFCPHTASATSAPSPLSDKLNTFIREQQQLLQIIYSNGYIHRFVDTPLYNGLLNILLMYKDNEQWVVKLFKEKDIATSFEYIVGSITKAGHINEAASLVLWWYGMHTSLQTLNTALLCLNKFINGTIRCIGNYLSKADPQSIKPDRLGYTWTNVQELLVQAKQVLDEAITTNTASDQTDQSE